MHEAPHLSPTMARVFKLVDAHFEPAGRIVAHAEALGIKRETAGRALRKLLAVGVVERNDALEYRLTTSPEVDEGPWHTDDLTRARCSKCGTVARGDQVEPVFGVRRDRPTRAHPSGVVRVQGQCRACRYAVATAHKLAGLRAGKAPG